MNRRLVIRCDGGIIQTQSGPQDVASGHLMRMRNIASYWTKGDSVVLVINQHCRGVESALEQFRELGCQVAHTQARECDSIADAVELVHLFRKFEGGLLYLDGYHFFSDYQHHLHKNQIRFTAQDDTAEQGPYFADLIVGGHIHAPDLEYRALNKTRYLLGTSYALLAEEFGDQRAREIPEMATRLLVTLGASDPLKYSEKCLRALGDLPDERKENTWLETLKVKVVVGSMNPRGDEIAVLADELAKSRGCQVSVIRDARSLRGLMDWAELAFSATGGTVLELLCAGVPVALQIAHPVQVPIARKLAKERACVLVGGSANASDSSPAEQYIGRALLDLAMNALTRRSMSLKGQSLVDGKGVERVCTSLKELLQDSQ